MKKTWAKSGNCLFLKDITGTIPILEKKVYTIEFDDIKGIYLKEMADSFTFDFKVYGMETDFVRRVCKTYLSTKGNLGVLMNGVKGTGKTITAELLANELKQPILLITSNYPGLNSFLSDLQENVTIVIDEYEKTFKGSISEDEYGYDKSNGDPTLLSLMDGVYKTGYRKVFILTTNELWLNDNMLNRPGRIRYLKTFKDLSLKQITEIVDDCLIEKKFKKNILEFLKPLKIITVDIVKSIVSEVNIHKEEPYTCCEHFNLERKDLTYDIVQISGGKEVVIHEEVGRSCIERVTATKR